MPLPLQKQLLEYGLARATAKKGAAKLDAPAYFGIKKDGEETKFKFTEDLQSISDDSMDLAMLIPDDQSFDLMAPADYGKKLSLKNPKTIRKFLSDLLDAI